MKKFNKLSVVFIGIITVALSFCVMLGQGFTAEAAESGKAEIILHKKKMIKPPTSLTQNTGAEMTEFDQYENLEGINFELYDATKEFYMVRESGKTANEAIGTIQSAKPDQLEGVTPVATGTTGKDGTIKFNVNKKVNDKDAVYLLVEIPKAGVTGAAQLVIGFPVFEMNKEGKYTDKELDTIHIYPKNIVTNKGKLLVNKIGTAKPGEFLNGAQFWVSKGNGDEKVYIESARDGLYTWTTDSKKAQRFTTGHSYAPGDNKITEVDNAIGRLAIIELEHGDYLLTEVHTPNNAAMINDQTKREFNIGEGEAATVEFDILNDTLVADKKSDDNNQSVEIGKKIKYDITSSIPLGINDILENGDRRYTSYKLIDKHSEELTFVNQKDASKEFAYELKDGDKVIAPDNYTVTENKDGFIVSINEDYIDQLTPNGKLHFSYYMYLNEKAKPGVGYTNTVKVETGELTTDTPPVTVKTGGVKFQKVDKDDKDGKGIKGAEFVVQDKDLKNYAVIDGKTKEVTWTTDQSKATVFTSDDNGNLEVTGLKYGTYNLVETKAPEGYVKLDKPLEFKVDANSYSNNNTVKVMNKHKGSLPMTGGMGTIIFSVVGISTFVLAILYFRRRLSNAN